MRCGFLFSKSGMLFVIIGLWFFCGLLIRFYNFGLEKFKCQTYTSHVRPCGLRGLCGLRSMLLSHTHKDMYLYCLYKYLEFFGSISKKERLIGKIKKVGTSKKKIISVILYPIYINTKQHI